jgi:hypothetical protein
MKRALAAALLVAACVPSVARAAPLQRLTVTSFTFSSDTAKPQQEVPFHLIVALHVRETVPEIDNVTLPVLVDVELHGDERITQAGPGGTDYRETITVVAHHAGKISLAPVTLAAIDPRDGKAKQYFTNALTLDVAGVSLAGPADEPNPLLQELGDWVRGFALWVVSVGALIVLVVVLLRRRPAPLPVAVAVAAPVPVPPPVPTASPRTRRDHLQDALTVLRADPNRPTAVRVRGVVWGLIGASEGETLADVLRRPEAADPRMSAVLRALERAAFTYDADLGVAIDGACAALERYLA